MDKSWKKQFEQNIRTRGKEYAYYYVSDYASTEKGYSATVSGKEDYKVAISSDYKDMDCSCAYAQSGKRCKHMAAVLYYAELLETEEKERERKSEEKIERQKLRAVILEMKENFGKGSVSNFSALVKPISEWKKEINDLIKHFKNKEGYIGYWEADSFIANLLDCFANLYALVSICEDKKAIDISLWLYNKIYTVGVDDSSTGCLGYFEEEMLELWTEISECSVENKEYLKLELTKCKHQYLACEQMLDLLR